MKKAAAILLAGVMAFGLIGCGGTQTSGSGQAEGAAQESSAAADNAAAESTAAESVQEEESSTQAQSADAAADGEGRQFIVGFDAEFPPYGYKDESGEYVGFDLDLAAEVCKRQGWELVKQPIDWDPSFTGMKTKTTSTKSRICLESLSSRPFP